MEKTTIHAEKEINAMLKRKALAYLPRNLGDVTAQQQILGMIAHVIPAVVTYIKEANATVWRKVNAGELPVNQAVTQCAYQTNRLLESAAVKPEALKGFSEEELLQAWIALDYYAYVLKPEYTAHLRQAKQKITDAVLSKEESKTKKQPAVKEQKQAEAVVPPKKDADHIPQVLPKNNNDVKIPVKPIAPVKEKKVKTRAPRKEKSKSGKKVWIPVAAIALVLCVAALFLLSDTNRTKASIRDIGTVTLDSEEKILRAEERYNALTESQQEKISNREDLFAARTEFDSLVVESAIEAIGTVTMESKTAIVNAEELYDDLSRESKNLVDNYKVLTDARKEFDRLDTAVQKASDAIDAIGVVTLQSQEKIEAAREAYDALAKDGLQKYLSDKVSTLTGAEAEYRELVGKDLYDTGMAHYEKGSYEEAIECFDSIIVGFADTSVLASAEQAKAESQTALAQAAYKKRDYYTAMKTLEAVDAKYQSQESYQTLHEQVITAITKARPKTGAAVAGSLKWGRCYFAITAGDQDVCFKFQNTEDPSKYKMVFVRAGESIDVKVEDGTYSIKWVTGKYWFDKDNLFGDDAKYGSRGTTTFTTTYDSSWVYFWYLTLDMSDPTFQFNTIDASEF